MFTLSCLRDRQAGLADGYTRSLLTCEAREQACGCPPFPGGCSLVPHLTLACAYGSQPGYVCSADYVGRGVCCARVGHHLSMASATGGAGDARGGENWTVEMKGSRASKRAEPFSTHLRHDSWFSTLRAESLPSLPLRSIHFRIR